VACAPIAQEKEKKRFFWPPYSDNPKIEYILFAQSDHDVRDVWSNWLDASILGVSDARRIFNSPQHIAAYESKVYVTDKSEGIVKVLDFKAQDVKTFDMYDEGRISGQIFANGIAVDDIGRIYISDSIGHQILEYTEDGGFVRSFGSEQLNRPFGLAVDRQRQRLYVVEPSMHAVQVFSLDGDHLATVGERGGQPGQFNFPLDVDVDKDGNYYVLDSLNARVQVFDPQHNFVREFGERGTAPGSFRRAKSLAVSSFGHVYVTDALLNKFVVFDTEGRFLLNIGAQYRVKDGVSPGGFYFPAGIDVDSQGGIWVVDMMNRMVHKFQYLSDEYLEKNPVRAQ
jgi:DNA-binding beta-propeller fold protein YncE